MDVFLTDTYLCKNCVRNRTVVRWIYTISPSGDPPGRKVRKVLGNVIVFYAFWKSSRTYFDEFLEHCVFQYFLAWLIATRRRECKSTMEYNTFIYFTQWLWGFRDRARRIPRGPLLRCFPMFLRRVGNTEKQSKMASAISDRSDSGVNSFQLRFPSVAH